MTGTRAHAYSELMQPGLGCLELMHSAMTNVLLRCNITNVSVCHTVFYVSFVITPLCSNASELVSSLVFAAKKTKVNTSLTFSQVSTA